MTNIPSAKLGKVRTVPASDIDDVVFTGRGCEV
jgi:hypothetical protein